MSAPKDESVAVVVIGSEPMPSLKALCDRHGWHCIVAMEVPVVLKSLFRRKLVVIIVEVVPARNACLQLIARLRESGQRAMVVAVAAPHGSELEVPVRAAGAHWYVPATDRPELLEQIVADILDGCEFSRGYARARPVRPIKVKSSSFPLEMDGRRA